MVFLPRWRAGGCRDGALDFSSKGLEFAVLERFFAGAGGGGSVCVGLGIDFRFRKTLVDVLDVSADDGMSAAAAADDEEPVRGVVGGNGCPLVSADCFVEERVTLGMMSELRP